VQILDVSAFPVHPVDRFDSAGFSVGPAGTSLHAVVVRLEPGGRIGRHPAVLAQALVPILGSGLASGADGTPHEISPGQAVLWRPGEEHETSTRTGLVALVLEGDLSEALLG
jgi:quercetin dioxygenase-like cupin family protein